MKKLTSSGQINTILGNTIIQLTGLDKKYVLNGKSLYGVNRETIDKYIAESFKEDDTYVVFLLASEQSSNNMTEETTDDKIDVYDSYSFTIMCYGENYNETAIKLNAKLLSSEMIQTLQNQGIHISSIECSNGYSEFINDILVNRRDVVLHISCMFEISKETEDYEMTQMNDEFKIETV